jgi:E3 ubiquitin-protein ligase HERC4
VYILLPLMHIFRNAYRSHDSIRHLIAAFARKIKFELNENGKCVLNDWWAHLEKRHFKDLIVVYKKSVIELMAEQERINERQTSNVQSKDSAMQSIDHTLHASLKNCLDLLEKLNEINKKHRKVSYKEFYIEGIGEKLDMVMDYIHWYFKKQKFPKNMGYNEIFFCDYAFILDANAKTIALSTDSKIRQQNAQVCFVTQLKLDCM